MPPPPPCCLGVSDIVVNGKCCDKAAACLCVLEPLFRCYHSHIFSFSSLLCFFLSFNPIINVLVNFCANLISRDSLRPSQFIIFFPIININQFLFNYGPIEAFSPYFLNHSITFIFSYLISLYLSGSFLRIFEPWKGNSA